jgi:hypothetical protein
MLVKHWELNATQERSGFWIRVIRGRKQLLSLFLTTGQGLRHVDLAVTRHRIAEMLAVPNLSPINEDHHVRPNRALLIEDVGASLWVSLEHGLEGLPHRLAFDSRRRAAHVTLDVGSESDSWHLRNGEEKA